MVGSRDSSPAPKAGGCICCAKAIGKKLALTCACCNKPAHLACLDEWKDITAAPDLAKVIGRTGILWYCHVCLPTLSTYFPAAGVREALVNFDKKLDTVTKLIATTHSTVKSYAQAVADSEPRSDPKLSEVKDLAERLGNKLKQETQDKETQQRKASAILHNISEEYNTHTVVFEILSDLSMHRDNVSEICRLGRKKTTYSKPRPIKIIFRSEINKIDFLSRYVNYDQREDSFATNDLPREMRDIEYKLRIKKRELSRTNTYEKYTIRNAVLYQLDKTNNIWNPIDININDIVVPSKTKDKSETDSSTTPADSNTPSASTTSSSS